MYFTIYKFNFCTIFYFYFNRYGILLAVKTLINIKKDEEFFANYGYQIGPKWFRTLFRNYAKENPTPENQKKLQGLDEFESTGKITGLLTLKNLGISENP